MLKALLTLSMVCASCFSQGLIDAEILAAMEHGKKVTAKKLWAEFRDKNRTRLNQPGLDPIGKLITVIGDKERIALEAAEASRQMRDLSLEQIKAGIPMGFIEVMLDCYSQTATYAGSLPKWTTDGGVHMVLKIGDQIIQPIASQAGGATVTYIPLYRHPLSTRLEARTWFMFPRPPDGPFTVTVISGEGKQKTKSLKGLPPW